MYHAWPAGCRQKDKGKSSCRRRARFWPGALLRTFTATCGSMHTKRRFVGREGDWAGRSATPEKNRPKRAATKPNPISASRSNLCCHGYLAFIDYLTESDAPTLDRAGTAANNAVRPSAMVG